MSITAVIATALKAATVLVGVGISKITILPVLIATLAYFNYELLDPERHPHVTKELRKEYDFVVVGSGSAGSVVVNRLTENPEWNVLLLEAGGHETELTDVPLLSLYLHKSKADWKYRTQPQNTACQAMVDHRCCWTRGKAMLKLVSLCIQTFLVSSNEISIHSHKFLLRNCIYLGKTLINKVFRNNPDTIDELKDNITTEIRAITQTRAYASEQKPHQKMPGMFRCGRTPPPTPSAKKILGGSSVLNTMLYIRGNRRDYDHWESLGNYGWGYEDVLPYFKKSEDQRNPYLARNTRYHSTGGYLTVQDSPYLTPLGVAFLQAGEEMGYDIVDINGEQQTGFALFQFTMRRGTRCSTAKAFLRPIQLRKNFHLSLWSHVTRVLIDPQSKRAYGVEFIRNGRKEIVYAKKEVILSAGAINSPMLLMHSGIGPRVHLEDLGIPVIQDSPGVGQNLQDHIAVGGLAFLIDYQIGLVFDRMVNINAALRYAITEDGPLTSSVGLETVAFISTKYANQSEDWPDIEFMLTSSSTNSDYTVKIAHGLSDEFYDEVFSNIKGHDVFGVFPMLLRPKSHGYLRLKSKNPLDHPLIYHNYLTHPDDVAVLREGIKASIAFAETSSMRRFGSRLHAKPWPNCKHIPLYTDEYWECAMKQYTMTIYHMSCSAKMGLPSDPMAVVDPELKVYGITGLRVIDASIMPTIISGNINAAVIMIGEKGADMVKAWWTRKGN